MTEGKKIYRSRIPFGMLLHTLTTRGGTYPLCRFRRKSLACFELGVPQPYDIRLYKHLMLYSALHSWHSPAPLTTTRAKPPAVRSSKPPALSTMPEPVALQLAPASRLGPFPWQA